MSTNQGANTLDYKDYYSILGVSKDAETGEIQKADGVTHLIAKSLWVPDVALAAEGHRSRDFH